MRKYFFVGPNKRLKSGMSIKVWKIERRNRRVQVWWGRARLDESRRPGSEQGDTHDEVVGLSDPFRGGGPDVESNPFQGPEWIQTQSA